MSDSLPLAVVSPNVPLPVRRGATGKRRGVVLDTPSTKRAALASSVMRREENDAPLPSSSPAAVADTSSVPSAKRTLSSSPEPPAWCSCGNCVKEETDGEGPAPVCCLDVMSGRDITQDSEGLCDSEEVAALLREGVCSTDFLRFTPRVFTRPPRPSSWEECNNAQKRLMLYAALHERIYRGGKKGKRDPMPECIKQRVREAFPR
jgi:hypothetical protein